MTMTIARFTFFFLSFMGFFYWFALLVFESTQNYNVQFTVNISLCFSQLFFFSSYGKVQTLGGIQKKEKAWTFTNAQFFWLLFLDFFFWSWLFCLFVLDPYYHILALNLLRGTVLFLFFKELRRCRRRLLSFLRVLSVRSFFFNFTIMWFSAWLPPCCFS